MTLAEPQSPSAMAQLALYLSRKGRPVWPLTVRKMHPITPRMMRVSFSCPSLGDLAWKRGQDLVLELPLAGGEIARRHYTIRDIEGGTLAIDFVRHGISPAGRWLDAVKPGDRLNAAGPRGPHVHP